MFKYVKNHLWRNQAARILYYMAFCQFLIQCCPVSVHNSNYLFMWSVLMFQKPGAKQMYREDVYTLLYSSLWFCLRTIYLNALWMPNTLKSREWGMPIAAPRTPKNLYPVKSDRQEPQQDGRSLTMQAHHIPQELDWQLQEIHFTTNEDDVF